MQGHNSDVCTQWADNGKAACGQGSSQRRHGWRPASGRRLGLAALVPAQRSCPCPVLSLTRRGAVARAAAAGRHRLGAVAEPQSAPCRQASLSLAPLWRWPWLQVSGRENAGQQCQREPGWCSEKGCFCMEPAPIKSTLNRLALSSACCRLRNV